MTKWAHQKVLDGGIDYLKAHCNKMALVSAYTANDSYATVAAAILAEVAMTTSDFTFSGSAGAARVCTTASGKQDASANASGGSATNHIAFLDTTLSEVLWVTGETSGQAVTTGNPVNFPSLTYTSNQPV